MPDGTSTNKILYFDGQPVTYLVRLIPTVCRTTADRSVMDEDGCGGTGWICPACHEGDDCMTVNSDECRPGRPGALSCVCAPPVGGLGAVHVGVKHAGEHPGIAVRWITKPVGA